MKLIFRLQFLAIGIAMVALPLLAGGSYADTKQAKWDVKEVEKGRYCFSQARVFPGLCVMALSPVETPIALDFRVLPENKNIWLLTFKTARHIKGVVYAEHMLAIIDKRTKKVIGQAPLKGFYVGGYWEDEFALEKWYEWKWTKNHVTVIGEEEGVVLDLDF